MAELVKEELEKRSVEEAEMKQQNNILDKAVVGQREISEEEFLPVKMDLVRPSSLPADVFDSKMTNAKSYST